MFHEGRPSAIQDESFDSNEDITRTHHSTLNQDDVNHPSPLLDIPTEDRNRQHDGDVTNEVAKTPEDRFHNSEGSPIFEKKTGKELRNLITTQQADSHQLKGSHTKTGMRSKEIEINNYHHRKKK